MSGDALMGAHRKKPRVPSKAERLPEYFKGKGAAVMSEFKKRYGSSGESAFYATVNKMRGGSTAQRAAQPSRAPGSLPASMRKR